MSLRGAQRRGNLTSALINVLDYGGYRKLSRLPRSLAVARNDRGAGLDIIRNSRQK